MRSTPISGVSPAPGTPERIADGLDALASQLQQAAEKLRVLAAEVRKVGESLKNWIEVAMRAGEKMAQQTDAQPTRKERSSPMDYRKLCKRLIIALRLEREDRKEQVARLQAEMRDLREEFHQERHWRRQQEKEREARLDVLVQKLLAAHRRGHDHEVERLADLLRECVSV